MIVIVYGDEEQACAASPEPELPPDSPLLFSGGDEPPLKPLYCIRGANWSECMATYHELQGLEPYVPFPRRRL